jgi:hypothetical protein
MKPNHGWPWLPGLVLAALAAGCGTRDTHDGLLAEHIAGLNEFNAILEGVTDETSAQAAAPKIDDWVERMQGLKQRSDALGRPTPDQEKQLQAKFEPQITDVMHRLQPNIIRIAMNPPLLAHLQTSLQKASGQMR